MAKPLIYIYDWKPECYVSLLDVAEIICRDQLPSSVDGMSALILHGTPNDSLGFYVDVVKEAREKKIPVFFQKETTQLLQSIEIRLRLEGALDGGVYFIRDFDELLEKVKSVIISQ